MLGLPDVLQGPGIREHLGRAPEEGGQGQLQDLDEGFQIFRDADQKVLVDQVTLSLFQGPAVSSVPALKIRINRIIYFTLTLFNSGSFLPF